MTANNRKPPDDTVLARDVRLGLTQAEIASRYSVTQECVRRRLITLKISPRKEPRRNYKPCGIPKLVLEKKVTTSEYGGSTIRFISLPRISMHVAAMEGRP